MSSQRGNTSRSRAQKHQNKTKFKNDLHDTSHTTKFINSLVIANVCVRCKDIMEWKIKYKKYKPLKSPSTCVKCGLKNVKQAYHTICKDCSIKAKVCPKCGKGEELIESQISLDKEKFMSNAEVQETLKSLTERKRRTFHRFMSNCKELSEEIVLQKLKELSVDTNNSEDLLDDIDSNCSEGSSCDEDSDQ